MLRVHVARNGQPTAVAAGVWLHSRYDPQQQARRYARECRGSPDSPPPSTVLLLGAGLGHLTSALSRELPASRLLAVYYHSALHAFAAASLPASAAVWHPGSPEGLAAFLRRHIGELDAEGLRVVEWEPSSRGFPELSLQANAEVAQLLKELRGSLVTTAALGRRWLRNSLYNLVALEAVGRIPRFEDHCPVVIAASGPTLESALPLIRRHRRDLLLWALPSSAAALQAADLRPDVVVLTDPGYYAVYHLHGALPPGTRLCMPLSAGTGVWRLPAAVSYFSQGSMFEQEILASLAFEGPTVAPSGTVSASALELALQCCRGPIVFAGLDFLFRDVHSHARPNAAQRLLHLRQARLAPLPHLFLAHALDQGIRPRGSTPALDTYAGWFARLLLPPGRRVFRLFASAVPVPGMPSLEEHGFRELFDPPAARSGRSLAVPPPLPCPPRQARRDAALRIIRDWIRAIQRSARALACAPSGSAPAALGDLLASARLMDLLYHCDAQRMAELRRRLRIEGPSAGAEAARALLGEAASFFEQLAERIEERA